MSTYNLIFHIYAIEHPMIRWHVDQILKFLPLFNGRKIITLAIGDTKIADELWMKLVRAGAEVYCVPNNADDREATPFFTVSGPKVAYTDPDTFLFYGHGKGASREAGFAIRQWCEYMYHHLLENFSEVQAAFQNPDIDACGIFKCVSPERNPKGILPGEWSQIGWHYPGTFFWVRQSAAFKHDWIFPTKKWEATSVELWPPYVIPDAARAANLCELPPEFGGPVARLANDLFFDNRWEAMYKRLGRDV